MKLFFIRIPVTILFAALAFPAISQSKAAVKPTTATTPKTEVLTNKSIIDLHEVGLSEDLIVAKIAGTAGKFDLTTDGLVQLKKANVPASVMKAMMDKNEGKEVKITKSEPAPQAAVAGSIQDSLPMVNHIYVYGKAITPLEKNYTTLRTKNKIISASSVLQLDGAKSPVRLTVADAGSFVINTAGQALPGVSLLKAKSAKGKREVTNMKVGSLSGMSAGESGMNVNVTKLKEGVFRLVPSQALAAGEYFFLIRSAALSNSSEVYAFGID